MIWQMKHGFGKILACCLLVVLLLAMSPWAALAEMPNAAGAVSYTHLDVYKRQVGSCSLGAKKPRDAIISILLMSCR